MSKPRGHRPGGEAMAVTEDYRNQVLCKVNGSCLRLAVFQGECRWHVHPKSDELFVILEGETRIEFKDRSPLHLGRLQAATYRRAPCTAPWASAAP